MSDNAESKLPLGLDDLLAASPDAIVVHDLEGRVLFWNQTAEHLYGWKAEEIKGRQINRIFYLETSERKIAVDTLLDCGKWSGELRQLDRASNEYLVDVRQQLHRNDSGEPIAVLSFNRDITDQRKQETAQERAYHIQSSNTLAGGIAHELNNALAPIMLSSAMLKRTVKDEKAKTMVTMMEKCATKGAELIADILAFERGKGGSNEMVREAQLIRSMHRAIEKVVPDRIDVSTKIAEGLWEFKGEASELEQAYQNIMENACDAMPHGGSLQIDVSNFFCDETFANMMPDAIVGSYVSITFKDTGFGIDKDIVTRVAEPFFTTKEPRQNYGFGLSNSQAIIKGHKGFMTLESEKGIGTTLTIFLPAQNSKPEDETFETSPPEEGQGKLILVADDEIFVRKALKRTLEERGYQVITAQDGTEALTIYASRREEIDIVVTNFEMPFIDGPALCRALKKLNPEVRILVSSGHQQKEKIAEIKSSGGDCFLPKPYTAEKLLKLIGIVLKG